jgi:hypothetical protein
MDTFEWKEDANQTYGKSYGSQTLYGSAFNKNFGNTFVMDAPNETLHLQYQAKSIGDEGGEWRWGKGESNYEPGARTLISISQGIFVLNGANTNPDVPDALRAQLIFGYGGAPPVHVEIRSNSAIRIFNFLLVTAAEGFGDARHAGISLFDSAQLSVSDSFDQTLFHLTMPLSAEAEAQLDFAVNTFTIHQGIAMTGRATAFVGCKNFELDQGDVRIAGDATFTLAAEKATARSSFILEEGRGKIIVSPNSNGDSPFNFYDDESLPKGLFNFINSGAGNGSVLTISIVGFNRANFLESGFIALNGQPLSSRQELYSRFDVTNVGEKYTFKLKS